MKKIFIQIFILLLAGFTAGRAGAQGSLTPPGAPAATMKTLAQIEARIPLIDSSPGVSVDGNGTITISQSGSYYLTGNVTVSSGDGILITADGVTVDLCGFTIRSTRVPSGHEGIDIDGNCVTIHNGYIKSGTTYTNGEYSGPGFDDGIYASSAYPGIRVYDVAVSGVHTYGIYLYSLDSIVRSSTVNIAGNIGIKAGIVRNCSAIQCKNTAIKTTVATDCRGESTDGDGISSSVIANSSGYSAGTDLGDTGITGSHSVQNCKGVSKGGAGILCDYGTVANSWGETTSFNPTNCGIKTHIAIGCYAVHGEQSDYKYDMP